MNIRNNTFTLINGNEFELSRDRYDRFVLYYRGNSCPDSTFVPIDDVDGVFKKIISDEKEITNAYSVSTYILYKGFKFQIDVEKNGMFRISTGDYQAYTTLNLDFIDRGWYEKWIPKSEIEKVWEERKPSGYDFPMPHGIEEIKEIVV